MGGSKLEENFAHPRQSYNGAQDTKQEILEAYEAKILDKEGEERSKGRNYVEGLAVDFLLTVQHVAKFCHVIVEVLNRSATGVKHWNPAAAAKAFRHIEEFALNLWDHPWKKEYKTIKLYSGFYKTQIEPHILGADELFKMMGYEGTPNTLVMRTNSSREQLIQTAVESFLLSVECNIYYMILQRVEHLGYTILDIHQCRMEFAAEIEPSVEWISKNRTPFKRKPAKLSDKIDEEIRESSDGSDSWTVGSSVKHTVNNIEEQITNNDVSASILRNDSSINRGKKGRVSADSGIGSKPASKEITPIEENDETEVDPAVSDTGNPRSKQSPVRRKESSPPKCDKEDPYALGTVDEHQLQSLKLVESLKRNKSGAKAVDTPIPPPRQKSKEWDHVTERLKNKYGQEYYEGPRGDILQLNNSVTTGGQSKGLVKQEVLSPVRDKKGDPASHLGPMKVDIPTVPPPNYAQAVAKGNSLQHQKPLVVNMPNVVQSKQKERASESNSGTSHSQTKVRAMNKDPEYHTDSFESRIKRPPSAEDILDEVLKSDEKYHTQHNDFTSFGKPSLPPARPSRNKKNSAARKSVYDNHPGSGPDQYRGMELVGRGISPEESDFYNSVTDSRPGRQLSPREEKSVPYQHSDYAYQGGDYGFNVNVPNKRRLIKQVSQPTDPNHYTTISRKEVWQCQTCTYANLPADDVCGMCGKSRESGRERAPLTTGGSQCPNCTLVNSQGQRECTACKADLKGSATYI